MNQTFGEFLAQKRREISLTQKQLAQMLFVTESTISKWEKNVANPDISVIPQLSSILKVTEHELITASIDLKQREINKNAKKWNAMISTWELFFYISYGLALLTCFIVDLATSGTLSWFWIVFTAIIFAASFTTIPKFIKIYKLLTITLLELILLFVLLFVINQYTNGNWLFLAITPVFVGFVIVFLPIYISIYKFPTWMKKHNALISLTIDCGLIISMLYILNIALQSNWFYNLALPLFAYCLIIVYSMLLICRYLKINNFLKSSLNIFVWILFLIFAYKLVNNVLSTSMKIYLPKITLPNFALWDNDMIQNNVFAIIGITMFLLAIIFLILGLIRNIKYKNEIKKFH